MKRCFHAAGGILAMALIATFWLSTLISELFLSHGAIVTVKNGVLYGMALMIPAMATAGATGTSLYARSKLPQVAIKSRRMKLIAINGIAILIPAAVFLALRARSDHFDSWFYALQVIELTTGAINFTLLSLNLSDGLALRKRRQRVLTG